MSDEPGPTEDTDLEHLSDEEREALKDPNNAANASAVRAKRNKAKLAAKKLAARDERIKNVVREMLKFEEGQEFFAWLLFDVAGTFRQEAPFSMDKDRMLFLCGAKGVGLALQDIMVAADPERYAALLVKRLKEGTDVS